jgi:hypothetical protein
MRANAISRLRRSPTQPETPSRSRTPRSTQSECARSRALARAAHSRVPDGDQLGSAQLVPAAAGTSRVAVGRGARIECSADLPVSDVTRLAAVIQKCLGRFASAAYKDARAPQNLYPIAGLERELRRRDQLEHAIRTACQIGLPR